jgi:hypothetical protein
METQKVEFDMLESLCASKRALPAVVDDDYPEARKKYETALDLFLVACSANGRVFHNPKLGATGNFPDGKLSDNDEGSLRMAIGYDKLNEIVHIEFGSPVAWLGLPPENAIQLALMMMKHAGVRHVEYSTGKVGDGDAETGG